MNHSTTLSPEEQTRRRTVMREALAQVRLEGLEPDPIVFTYIERYARGEMTLADAIATYTAHLNTILNAPAQAR
ncbi:MAG TPA: antitoxin VbhA family protein [Ktedonobacterales bacterium]|nr:antitoxin VbhA family protein [Ktedonobacterales bacterium]